MTARVSRGVQVMAERRLADAHGIGEIPLVVQRRLLEI